MQEIAANLVILLITIILFIGIFLGWSITRISYKHFYAGVRWDAWVQGYNASIRMVNKKIKETRSVGKEITYLQELEH